MRIHVAIATTGRPDIATRTVARLRSQSRPADGIVVVGAQARDLAGIDATAPGTETLLAPRGLCKQRNAALDWLEGKSDVIVFFDDDFVPAHDYLANLERLMSETHSVVGATGWLVDDGAQGDEIDFAEAERRLDVACERPKAMNRPCASLYGCNMAFRLSVASGMRFDEHLPLYGWQEDVDFTHQLSWRGTLLRTSTLTGIHLGTRGGRTSGRRLGYSQVANVVYLWRKGTMRPWLGERLLFQNIVSNVVRSVWPEPDIDRRGRLMGNLLAILDLWRGTLDPCRIEAL